jgi:hypothetical protein
MQVFYFEYCNGLTRYNETVYYNDIEGIYIKQSFIGKWLGVSVLYVVYKGGRRDHTVIIGPTRPAELQTSKYMNKFT